MPCREKNKGSFRSPPPDVDLKRWIVGHPCAPKNETRSSLIKFPIQTGKEKEKPISKHKAFFHPEWVLKCLKTVFKSVISNNRKDTR